MRKIVLIIAAMMFFAVPQIVIAGPVSEAKKKIEQEKHESLVNKSKTLLERKAKIESELAEINKNLSDLEEGKDVDTGTSTIISTSSPVWSCSNCLRTY